MLNETDNQELSEETLLELEAEARTVTNGQYVILLINTLRATRRELTNTQTMESAQKQLSDELVDRLSRANERIAELEQANKQAEEQFLKENERVRELEGQLADIISFDNVKLVNQAQHDRERIEELEYLLTELLDYSLVHTEKCKVFHQPPEECDCTPGKDGDRVRAALAKKEEKDT